MSVGLTLQIPSGHRAFINLKARIMPKEKGHQSFHVMSTDGESHLLTA